MHQDTTTRPRPAGRNAVATFGQGRTCVEAGCDTHLSRYNDEDVCGVHSARPRR